MAFIPTPAVEIRPVGVSGIRGAWEFYKTLGDWHRVSKSLNIYFLFACGYLAVDKEADVQKGGLLYGICTGHRAAINSHLILYNQCHRESANSLCTL